jgi:hypothetical protein
MLKSGAFCSTGQASFPNAALFRKKRQLFRQKTP